MQLFYKVAISYEFTVNCTKMCDLKKKRKHEGPLNHSYELATSLAVCNIVTNYHDIMLDVYNFESFDK